MRIGVPRETAAGERRVALVADGVKRLAGAGHELVVESGAGARAFVRDADYAAAGARIVSGSAEPLAADLVLKVQAPDESEIAAMRAGAVLVALLRPGWRPELPARLAEREISGLALELVPRISRAQSMDVLSSQATVAGYRAVLIGAARLPRFLPMLTTAAGSIVPSKVFVIGAGVAGLQAIATARRLGGVVSAFDVRAAAREQVESLGASFVAGELVSPDAEEKGGYARAQGDDEQRRTLAAIAAHLPGVDLVITTAQLPGKPAPRLITTEMLGVMRNGSVVVDLAAETGGNCEATRAGEDVEVGGVTVMGPTDVASGSPLHASQMFSRNVVTLVQHLLKDGAMALDGGDEIVRAMLVTPPRPRPAIMPESSPTSAGPTGQEAAR